MKFDSFTVGGRTYCLNEVINMKFQYSQHTRTYAYARWYINITNNTFKYFLPCTQIAQFKNKNGNIYIHCHGDMS